MKPWLALALGLALFVGGCGEDARENPLTLATVESPPPFGLQLRELPPSTLRSIGLHYGLVVVRAGGLAERAGLRMGDVVYGVNQKKIASLAEFRQLVETGAEGKRLGLLVRRGASDFYVALEPGALRSPEAPRKGLPPRDTLLRT